MDKDNQLTLVEKNDLQYHEQRIEAWSQHTEKAAESFKEIRDGRLYKETHSRFEDYCRDRWGHTRQHINRLIRCAGLVEKMEPIGSKITTESQARELAKVPAERREEVLKITEHISGGRVTARRIKATHEELQKENPFMGQDPYTIPPVVDTKKADAKKAKPVEVEGKVDEDARSGIVGFAMSHAEGAIDQLNRIPSNDQDLEKAYLNVIDHCIKQLSKHKPVSKIKDEELNSEWKRLEVILEHLREPEKLKNHRSQVHQRIQLVKDRNKTKELIGKYVFIPKYPEEDEVVQGKVLKVNRTHAMVEVSNKKFNVPFGDIHTTEKLAKNWLGLNNGVSKAINKVGGKL